MSMVKKSGVDIAGRKAIVLGSGGASATICAVLNELNAKSVAVISRSGQDNYENIQKHADAEIIVNTTPVGMYPNTGVSPVDLSVFKGCKGVLDIVYNPHRTALLMQAEKLGIPCMGNKHGRAEHACCAGKARGGAFHWHLNTRQPHGRNRARIKPEYAKHCAYRHAGLRQEHHSRGAGQKA